MVLAIGFTVFYFLNSLNQQIENITTHSREVSLMTDQVSISAVSILKIQKKILTSRLNNQAKVEDIEKLNGLCEGFHSELQRLDTFYTDVQIKTIISKMIGYVESLQTILSKVSVYNNRDYASFSTIGDLAVKILEAFSDFKDIQNDQNDQRGKKLKEIIGETRRYMLIVLIITFLFTIILSLVVPGKIALPFKKINDAVRELQDCNFDVSIYYKQNDEIGELAQELNKMIGNMKHFEELRTDRVSVEHRKFDILANMIKKNIIVANANGKLIYLNNKMYKTLNIESQDILNKAIDDVLIPGSIKETFELALKRRSKIENSEVVITEKVKTETEDEESGEMVEVEEDKDVFTGYANVIPIRAKVSSLDYYMMVLSEEIFS